MTFLKFMIGGKYANWLPFNGQTANMIMTVGDGIFCKDEAAFEKFIKDF